MAMETNVQTFTPGQCLFPVSKGKPSENSFGTICFPLPPHEYEWASRDYDGWRIHLYATWALLLRSFLSESTIFFATVGDEEINTAASDENREASIWCYGLSENATVCSISPVGHAKRGIQQLRDLKINTAVVTVNRDDEADLDNPMVKLIKEQVDLLLVASTPLQHELRIEYRYSAISEPYASFISETYQQLLVLLENIKGLEIRELDMVVKSHKKQMASWNHVVLSAHMVCVHQLVEATARVIPTVNAVEAWDGTLTYTELESVSSRAALKLVQTGVRVGDFVPFAFEKSMWTVVATLAILKAGAAFVPLDPLHPKSRLQDILNSTKARVVVSSESCASLFRDLDTNIVIISGQTTVLNPTDQQESFSQADVGPKDPVFVLFTSGSTGNPKGMIHEHGAISTHAITHGKLMGYHNARVVQFAAHTFDVAIIDIFTTLIYGGCICIPSEEDRKHSIVSFMNEMRVDLAIFTPVMANVIDPSDIPTLKTLAVGGEALAPECLERWVDKVSFIQIYGPAEAGICLAVRMDKHSTRADLVGYPLSNCSCWLVDPEDPNKLVPPGAIGELVIASPSLARGYLNDTSKTAASFVQGLTWSTEMNLGLGRFYRTGDLLRHNSDTFDGSFEFIGRYDHQIKLRGFRIEPGEIEHHLLKISGVTSALVVSAKEGPHAGELVAVVQVGGKRALPESTEPIVVNHDNPLPVHVMKCHLEALIPDYMIPTRCYTVMNIPVIPSMKVDRNRVKTWLAQASPAAFGPVLQDACFVGTVLKQDELIARDIASKVVDLVSNHHPSVGSSWRDRDFALQDAGLDSIQIMSLSLYIQKLHMTKIPLSQLLQPSSTIRTVAHWITDTATAASTDGLTTSIDVIQEAKTMSSKLVSDVNELNDCAQLTLPSEVKNIFVTGSTGYLGRTILQFLLQNPDVTVFALVRCETSYAGLGRLVDVARLMGWWDDSYLARLHIWSGDLSKPSLGLNASHLDFLLGNSQDHSQCIHAILHSGAKVHYSSDFSHLKATNVMATNDLLRFAAQSSSVKVMVFVSGGTKPTDKINLEDPSSRNWLNRENGYVQTKFVAEQLVRSVIRHRSFEKKHLCIIRPGYIVGARMSGLANTTDFLWRMIAGCVEIEAYAADEAHHWLYVAEVDRVARAAIAYLFKAPSEETREEAILDGLRFSDLWRLLRDEFGYRLESLEHHEWADRLRSVVWAKQEEHLLFPLLDELERSAGTVGVVACEQQGDGAARIKDVMRSNIRQLIQTGFLPAPPRVAQTCVVTSMNQGGKAAGIEAGILNMRELVI